MEKEIKFGDETRKKLKKGVDTVASAVGTTLGPKGRNVALERVWGMPNVVHDGVTIAREIELKDKFENIGAQMIREASLRTNDKAGDGTTTAAVIAQALVDEGYRMITAGSNPMIIKRGLDKAGKEVITALKSQAKKIKSHKEKKQIATISSGDEELGKIIADVFEEVGDDGVVAIEEGNTIETNWEIKEGMVLDNGFASPYFVTNQERMEAVIDKPYILITDESLSTLADLKPLLEGTLGDQQVGSLVIIAEKITDQALATLVANKLQGRIKILALNAPGFGDRKKDILQDIATVTGAEIISSETGRDIKLATFDDLGKADQIRSTKNETVIIGGKGKKKEIESRIIQLKNLANDSDSDFDVEKYNERIAKLSGGIAVINAGGATELEMKERKYRIEDAVNATRAATEEGVVSGGGVAFIKARKALDSLKLEGDEKVGVYILKKALDRPTRKLVENAGIDSGSIIDKITESEENIGFDVITMSFVDLFKKGIIDPVKVSRSAVQNAVSVAGAILTTEVVVVHEGNPKEELINAGGDSS